ncbi:ubiquinone/menaquinone biosynthesis C-methylase UbiE [Sedimentibacter acidaminivorans]|jgi:ubiquinone/menaquinone biosynthesis C-methylase UbiE|uniref:Ubiquinone/menaquinone biosynthesis C-methylase UbiE n=1 Tax=Sedimentibacter acidaminivorans TaxID=913099 RepID=A0ABS4GEK4_9FIRM|nr:class I SAM-dependent methyltransferase [Sedimentibacter acidaminivorans]MBP1926126.1 ubiquinone/menaquinone biosynthesis C-methylase UbiE [Sedimentibacter acidaminivorans]
MSIKAKLCIAINKLFKLPVHPFNLSNEGKKTYAEWQYEKGIDTIKFYLKCSTTDEMFKDKVVLDIGCGAGGKTIFYASQGVKNITGVEILEKYKDEAVQLAKKYNMLDKFSFVCADASKTPFDDETFDTIIMNDAMEHVDEPEKVLDECYRILKNDGKLYLNFPPYNHPYGAHLSDAIGMPWVHVFFSEKTLIKSYKQLVKDLPDGKDRIKFRIDKRQDGTEYFSYINKMTINRFQKIMQKSKFNLEYYKEEPLRNIFKYPAKLPFFKEFLVKMVVCVLVKKK